MLFYCFTSLKYFNKQLFKTGYHIIDSTNSWKFLFAIIMIVRVLEYKKRILVLIAKNSMQISKVKEKNLF